MKHLVYKVSLIILLVTLITTRAYSHSGWSAHANDMMAVFGFEENPQLRAWMRFISSDMIDKHEPFYSELCKKHPGFRCKHRLLFHWGFNAKPWSKSLESRIIDYCKQYDLNVESNLRIFQAELIAEQRRRNKLINSQTERLFGFAQGGKDASFANFFASMAYNIHLIGDYTSDNTDLDGLPNINDIIGVMVRDIRSLDNVQSQFIVKGITKINQKYSDPQIKADELMIYLKTNMPQFIRKAQFGSLYSRLNKRGFNFRN